MAPGQVRKMAELCDSGYILWRFLSCLRAIFENFSSQIVVKFCRTDSSRRHEKLSQYTLPRRRFPLPATIGRESHHPPLLPRAWWLFYWAENGAFIHPKAALGNHSCPGRHRFARCPRLSGWRTESGRPAAPWGTVRCGRQFSGPVGFPPR